MTHDMLEIVSIWIPLAFGAAVGFGVMVRRRAVEDREREEEGALYAELRARRDAPSPAEAYTDPDELPRPGFDIDQEEDHRLDDPRYGQAAGLNRRYQ